MHTHLVWTMFSSQLNTNGSRQNEFNLLHYTRTLLGSWDVFTVLECLHSMQKNILQTRLNKVSQVSPRELAALQPTCWLLRRVQGGKVQSEAIKSEVFFLLLLFRYLSSLSMAMTGKEKRLVDSPGCCSWFDCSGWYFVQMFIIYN